MKAQRIVWALNRLPGFGIQTFKCLQENNLNLTQCEDSELLNFLHGLNPNFSSELSRILDSSEFESDLEKCQKSNIRILSILDSDYPSNLTTIYDPPLILYVKGQILSEDQFAIAIVGSRRPSVYGIRMAAQFSSELSERGITIISGFARGIDGEAHRSALRSKGRTIAVLGCGLDVIYPKEHAELYQKISENGAIVSEFPLGTSPQAYNFPKRNRIITGLSMGVLVVEASQRSGSLITASIATEEGREVYAVPGQIDVVTAQGTNHLIQNGAKLVMSVDDILIDLHGQLRASLTKMDSRHCEEAESRRNNPSSEIASLTSSARNDGLGTVENDNDIENDLMLKLLTNKPLSLDEIIVSLGGAPKDLSLRLVQLEVKGVIQRCLGGKYTRSIDTAIT